MADAAPRSQVTSLREATPRANRIFTRTNTMTGCSRRPPSGAHPRLLPRTALGSFRRQPDAVVGWVAPFRKRFSTPEIQRRCPRPRDVAGREAGVPELADVWMRNARIAAAGGLVYSSIHAGYLGAGPRALLRATPRPDSVGATHDCGQFELGRSATRRVIHPCRRPWCSGWRRASTTSAAPLRPAGRCTPIPRC